MFQKVKDITQLLVQAKGVSKENNQDLLGDFIVFIDTKKHDPYNTEFISEEISKISSTNTINFIGIHASRIVGKNPYIFVSKEIKNNEAYMWGVTVHYQDPTDPKEDNHKGCNFIFAVPYISEWRIVSLKQIRNFGNYLEKDGEEKNLKFLGFRGISWIGQGICLV